MGFCYIVVIPAIAIIFILADNKIYLTLIIKYPLYIPLLQAIDKDMKIRILLL